MELHALHVFLPHDFHLVLCEPSLGSLPRQSRTVSAAVVAFWLPTVGPPSPHGLAEPAGLHVLCACHCVVAVRRGVDGHLAVVATPGDPSSLSVLWVD